MDKSLKDVIEGHSMNGYGVASSVTSTTDSFLAPHTNIY